MTDRLPTEEQLVAQGGLSPEARARIRANLDATIHDRAMGPMIRLLVREQVGRLLDQRAPAHWQGGHEPGLNACTHRHVRGVSVEPLVLRCRRCGATWMAA